MLTVTRTEYEKWLSCLENGTDVEGKEISADAQSPMYFSIGFYGEDNAMVAADNFYIEDLAIKKTDKSLAPIVGFKGKSNGNTNVTTAVQVVERLADDFAAQIIKTDDQAYSVFGLDASWLADAFADTNTTGVSFKIYSAHPIYRTGGGYNNTFVKDTAGKLQRTSWNFAGAAPTKTDGYFLFTVTRAEYEKWLNCVTNSKDVGGTAISVDAQSAMYFSVGFYGECNAFVQPDNFYIDDLVVVKAEA